MKIAVNLRAAIVNGWQYVLNTGQVVEHGFWQGKTAPRPLFEALDYTFKAIMPNDIDEAKGLIEPNLPWADQHFTERVGGKPLNPPPSNEIWPFAQAGNADFKKGKSQLFDHTYPERIWPKNTRGLFPLKGIRFEYGDLDDVVNKLNDDPLTRQAFLPIWFPEDTGKSSNIRVPCSIGYHFMIRHNRLDITYWMRSLDMLRHFQDDIYLCWRLADWVIYQLNKECTQNTPLIRHGYMKFHAVSAHIFNGEQLLLNKKIDEWKI